MPGSIDGITLADLPYTASTSKASSLQDGALTPCDGKTIVGLTEGDLVDQTLYLPPAKVRLIVISLGMSFFLSVLEQTILATALPSIASSFDAGEMVSWVVTSFLLGSTAISPFYGRLADIFGRKQVMLCCTVTFFFSTLACSFAQSIVQLIIFRSIQGASSSGMGTLGYIVLSDIVPLTERGKYQGIIDAICVCAQAAGPVVGAVLVTNIGWRSCFWVMLGPIVVTGCLQAWLLPSKKACGDWKIKVRSIDYVGCLISLAATTLLLIGISRGGIETAWTSAATIAPLVLSASCFIAFGFWEAKGATLPIIPIRLFRIPTVISAHLSTLTSMAGNFIIMFYVPNFLQIVRGLPIITSGLAILPYGVGISVFVCVSVVSSKYVGTRPLLIVGFGLWSVMAGLLVTWNSKTSLPTICGILTFGAIGGGLTIATSMMAAESAVPRADRAVVTGSRNYARLLGAAIGTGSASTIVTNDMKARLSKLGLAPDLTHTILNDPPVIQGRLKTELPDSIRLAVIENYVQSYRLLFWIVTGLMLFALFISVTLLRYHPLEREDDAEQKESAKLWLEEQEQKKKEKDIEAVGVTVKEGEQTDNEAEAEIDAAKANL